MYLERVKRWPCVPWWAALLVALHLGLVGVCTLISRDPRIEAPTLCLFRHLTGRPCPSCGTTRMVLALGRGELRTAIAFNPLVFVVTVAVLGVLILRIGFRRRLVWLTSPARRRLFTGGLVLAVLVNWLYLLAGT